MKKKQRLHPRMSRPDVRVDSPLIDCRLLNLSTSGLAVETSVGLRLGVPYPFRLNDGQQVVSTEARVRWCRLVRNETVDGESRPVYQAGAAFVEWQPLNHEQPVDEGIEDQIDATVDSWLENSRTHREAPAERTIIRRGFARRP